MSGVSENVAVTRKDREPTSESSAIMAALQQEWQQRWERIRSSAAPHRFTYPGQRMPWIDPVPAPHDPSRYTGPAGASPRVMVETVFVVHRECGREAALPWLLRCERRISSLGRPDWDARVAALRAVLEA